MKKEVHYYMENETKGSVRYFEVSNPQSTEKLDYTQAVSPTLYVRKSAFNGTIPKRLKVTIESA